jgi:ABC-type transporter Mla MlaB component
MLDVTHDGDLFEVRGSLDDDGGRRLLRALATCDGDVRIDGSGLDRIDGAGLTALVLAQRECREQGRRFELLVVAPEALVGLRTADRFVTLFEHRPVSGRLRGQSRRVNRGPHG